MQSLLRHICRAGSQGTSLKPMDCISLEVTALPANLGLPQRLLGSSLSGMQTDRSTCSYNQSPSKLMKPYSWVFSNMNSTISCNGVLSSGFGAKTLATKCLSTMGNANMSVEQETPSSPAIEHPPRIKFKRLDKTARHIMNILNKEAVEKVHAEREIPDVQPGCIVQMRVQVPENKRRESTLKGIVIARRNAGINTTFRLRRLVAGVGVESVFPLYSPNIKEIKILDRKKVRRAKLYYLRDRMNPLKK